MTFLRVLALCLIVAPAGLAAEPDYAKMKEEWAEKLKKTKEDALGKLNAQIEEKEAAIKQEEKENAAKKKKATPVADKLRPEITDLKARAARVERRDHCLDVRDLKVGDFGVLGINGDGKVKPILGVLQVQDKGAALMTAGKLTFWVETDTKGMTDGSDFEVKGFVHAKETKTYETTLGKKTVLVLKIVP